MNQQAETILTRGNDQGEHLNIAGGKYRILIGGDETGGSHAVIEMQVPPGGGPPPHSHKDICEMFFVAEGEVEFRMVGAKYKATKGAFINIPLGGAVHAFKNVSDQPATLICTVIPAGLDSMFKEVSAAAGPEEAKTISEKYKQEVYPADYLD